MHISRLTPCYLLGCIFFIMSHTSAVFLVSLCSCTWCYFTGSSADVSRVASESADASSEGDDEGRGEADRGQLRRDVMLGRMVQLMAADAGGPLPSASLPLLAEQLQASGLLPRWVVACLTHKPSLFDKAFTLLFKEVCCCIGHIVVCLWWCCEQNFG